MFIKQVIKSNRFTLRPFQRSNRCDKLLAGCKEEDLVLFEIHGPSVDTLKTCYIPVHIFPYVLFSQLMINVSAKFKLSCLSTTAIAASEGTMRAFSCGLLKNLVELVHEEIVTKIGGFVAENRA